MIFRKEKMLARLEKEGRAHLVDNATMDIMNSLDGKPAIKNDFKALVHDVEEYMVNLNGEYYLVNKLDCE